MFTGGTNYKDQSGSVAIVIGKADAVCTITGYTGTYDAAAHGATGVARRRRPMPGGGQQSEPRRQLHERPGGTANWAFTGGTNYNNQSGTVAIVINKADAVCTINGYTGAYDAAAHSATGTAPASRPIRRRRAAA